MSEDTVLKEGWATKQGGFWKTWKKRWFVLIGKTLEYCKQPGVQPQGKIDLNEVNEISVAHQCKKGPALQLVTPERTYFMVFQNDSEVQDWIDVLKKAKDGKKVDSDDGDKSNSISNYRPLRILAKGVNSIILLVRHLPTNNLYAAKRYSKKAVGDQTEILEKYKSLKDTKHDYIIDFVDVIQENDAIFFICEYVEHALPEVLNNSPLENDTAITIFSEILQGLTKLHENGLYYGDFHIGNVLLDENGHVKLSLPGIPMPIANTQERHLQYINPKALETGKIDKSYDKYGAAIILFEMLAGYPPFVSSDRAHLIEETKRPIVYPEQIVDVYKNILDHFLSQSAKEEGDNAEDPLNSLQIRSNDQLMSITKKFGEESKHRNSWVDDEPDHDLDYVLISFADDSVIMKTF